MRTKAYSERKPFRENVRLVILDLDCFLYPYDKAYRNAVLRAWRAIRKEYGLPIFRRSIAQKLIEEAKEKANKNADDALCQHISKLAERLESKGLSGASLIGMLEAYYRSAKAARADDIRHDQSHDPPYKDMIAMAFNLRLLQDRKNGKKAKLTGLELTKSVEGEAGITRLWNRHMGTDFICADPGLASKIQQLKEAGIEIAVLTHSFKHGEGEASEKLEKLALKGVIAEDHIFGLEEISPYKKGQHPEVFEKVLSTINSSRGPGDPIMPVETIMAEDTIGNLRGAKKAGMQTVWVPRRVKDLPGRSSQKLEKNLACVDHIYATPHQFLDALDTGIRARKEMP